MQVKPEVSDGEINPDTLLPEEETREVETSVLLDNHQGVIIGGLIQEKDRTVIKKFPWLGDVRYVGKLFQRREAVRSRTEIIIALVPHIIERCVQDERSAIEYERTETPLLHGALHRNCRPWEPRLPDRSARKYHMDVESQSITSCPDGNHLRRRLIHAPMCSPPSSPPKITAGRSESA